MNEALFEVYGSVGDLVLDGVASRTRRELLLVLRDRAEPVAVPELASAASAALAADDAESAEEAGESLHVRLVHTHLPKLDEAGLVEWDAAAGTVAAADHPALRDRRLWRLIETDAAGLDRILAAIRSTTRRTALAVLAETDDGVDRRALARRVAAREEGVSPAAVSEEATRSTLIALHHVHLPKLQQAGLIVYEDETARYAGHSDLRSEWLSVGSGARETETAA